MKAFLSGGGRAAPRRLHAKTGNGERHRVAFAIGRFNAALCPGASTVTAPITAQPARNVVRGVQNIGRTAKKPNPAAVLAL
jgi:hypothetical protein